MILNDSEQRLAMVGEESDRVTVTTGSDMISHHPRFLDEVTFKTSSTTSSKSDSGVLCGFLSFAEKNIFSPGKLPHKWATATIMVKLVPSQGL